MEQFKIFFAVINNTGKPSPFAPTSYLSGAILINEEDRSQSCIFNFKFRLMFNCGEECQCTAID